MAHLAGSSLHPKDQKDKCGYFCPHTKLVQGAGAAAAQRKAKSHPQGPVWTQGPGLTWRALSEGQTGGQHRETCGIMGSAASMALMSRESCPVGIQ